MDRTIKILFSFIILSLLFSQSAHSQSSETFVPAPSLEKSPSLNKFDNSKPLDKFELDKYRYCGSDLDCMYVVNGCCDCNHGGEDVAINKEHYYDFNSRFQCLGVKCSKAANQNSQSINKECAKGLVSCINHKCRYVKE